MRPLQPSEKRLLAVFGVLLVISVAFVGGSEYLQWIRAQQSYLARLRGDRQIAEVWLKQADLWRERSAWLTANLPRFSSREEAVGKLPTAMKLLAEANGLQVLEQGFTADQPGDPVSYAGVRLRVTGGLPQTVRWLHALQQPNTFNRIDSIQIEPGDPPTTVRCDLRLIHFFTVQPASG
ncbi:MAG: hypothetical protein OHK005_13270 [Candidatus Methylacidiphilales bacterium]